MAHADSSQLPLTPLVTTEWLADHLADDGLVVLDATVLQVPGFNGGSAYVSGEEEYLVKGHIPGAVFADVLETFSDPEGEFKFTRPSAKLFEGAAQSVGVDNDTAVVVYDNSVGQWAARIWWLFRTFGFEVHVLDGGFAKWRAEGRPVELGHVAPRRAGDFSADELEGVWVDKQYVSEVLSGQHPAVLVCGAPPKEFTGEVSSRSRAGHIPGSFSAPAGRLVDRDTNAYLPVSALGELFADVTAPGEPIITYCGGGIAAASDALALALLGRTDVALYDGSLNEWAADENAPLAAPALASQV